jgi:hypothetical protein
MTVTTDTPYYDDYDCEIDADPYPACRRLRHQAPLYYNEKFGFYALSRDRIDRSLRLNEGAMPVPTTIASEAGANDYFCLGARSARHEASVTPAELFKRFSEWEVDWDNAVQAPSSTVREGEKLPVRAPVT